MSYAWTTSSGGSPISRDVTGGPCDHSMSFDHAWCSLTPSTLIPIVLQLRAANSFCNAATAPSSVVHTGVKSLGWEKRIAQPSPIQSWKLIVPCVVSAVKSGAVSLMRSDMGPPWLRW